MIEIITDLSNGKQISLEDVLVTGRSIIGIDASTTCSGVCIVDLELEKPVYSIMLKRETNKKVSSIQYKVEFKKAISDLLLLNRSVYRNIRVIVQEEPFMSAMVTSSSVLMSLRTSVPELLIERSDLLSDFEYHELNNKTWKKELFAPDKCPSNSEEEKKLARKKIESICMNYKGLTQDEIDAAGVGIIAARMINKTGEIKEKKRYSKFKYNIEFFTADSLELAIEDLSNSIDYYDIPESVVEAGIKIAEMPKNGDLDKKIFMEMGEDDKLLLFEFQKKKAGNIVMKYRLHDLCDADDKIYCVVWRENRKK